MENAQDLTSEAASTRIPLINSRTDFIMVTKFTALSRSDSLADFAQKPFVVTNHPFYSFNHQRLGGTALLGSKTGEFRLQIRVEGNFHGFRLGSGAGLCQRQKTGN